MGEIAPERRADLRRDCAASEGKDHVIWLKHGELLALLEAIDERDRYAKMQEAPCLPDSPGPEDRSTGSAEGYLVEDAPRWLTEHMHRRGGRCACIACVFARGIVRLRADVERLTAEREAVAEETHPDREDLAEAVRGIRHERNLLRGKLAAMTRERDEAVDDARMWRMAREASSNGEPLLTLLRRKLEATCTAAELHQKHAADAQAKLARCEAERDEARSWFGQSAMHDRCVQCGHRLRFMADGCPSCGKDLGEVPPWRVPSEGAWPDTCDCDRCVEARAALADAEETP